MRSHGLGGGRGFTGQHGRGSAPSAALGRLEDGAPAPRARYAPRGWFLLSVLGMRLVQYQLLTLSGCGRPACPVCASMHTSDMPLSAPI